MADTKSETPPANSAGKKPEVKRNKPQDYGFEVGIRFWVAALVGFVLLGYPLMLSIIFGAIAGIAGGAIATWGNEAAIYGGKIQDINDADVINASQPEDLVEEVRTKRRKRYSTDRRRRDRDSEGKPLQSWIPWRKSRE